MADSLDIKIKINFEEYDKVKEKLDKILNRLKKESKLNVQLDTKKYEESINKITKQLENLKKKINGDDFSKSFGVSKIEELNRDLNEIKKTYIQIGNKAEYLAKQSVKYIDNTGKLVNLTEQYDKKTGQVVKTTEKITENLIRIKKMGELLKSGINNFDRNSLEKYIKDIYGANIEITQLEKRVDNAGNEFWQFQTAVRKSGDEVLQYKGYIDKTTKSIYQLGETTKKEINRDISLWKKLKIAISAIAVWDVGTNLFYGLKRNIREGIAGLIELDKTLTEISTVTGKNRDEIRQLGLEYNKLAKKLKVTTKEITESSMIFYRQGLNDEEVRKRVEVTTKAAATAAMDFNETANLLTATVNGMRVDIEKASDVFLKLGASAGTSFGELATGLSKVASSANTFGVSFEKISSWIATVSEVTRESAESIGTSFKTILARFNKLNEDGSVNEDLNKIDTALKSVGISLTDLNGQIRPLEQVIDELAQKWEGLDKNTKAYLATQIAGTRQQARFLALMQNYNRSMELYNIALDSAGTTTEQYMQTLKGIQSYINEFTATIEGFWIKAISSETIKKVISFGTDIVQVLDIILEKGKLLQTLMLTGLIPVFLKLNTSLSLVTKLGLVNLIQTVAGVLGTKLIPLLGEYNILINVATSSTLAFKVATFGVVAVLGAIVTATIAHANAERKRREELEKSINTVKQLKDEVDTISKLRDEYKKLKDEQLNGKDVKEDLLEVQEKLANIFPETATGINQEGKAYADNIDIIDKVAKKKKELLKLELLALKVKADKELPLKKAELEELNKQAKEIEKKLRGNTKKLSSINIGGIYMPIIVDKYDEYVKQAQKINEKRKELIDEINSLENAQKMQNEMYSDGTYDEGIDDPSLKLWLYKKRRKKYENSNDSNNENNDNSDLIKIDDTYFSIQERLEAINYEIEKQKLLLEQAEGQDKIDILYKINDLYASQQQALKDLNSKREEEIATIKEKIKSFVKFDESGRNIIEVTRKVNKEEEELINNFQNLTDLVDDTKLEIIKLDNEMSNNIKTIEDVINVNEELADSYNFINDTFDRLVDALRRKYEEDYNNYKENEEKKFEEFKEKKNARLDEIDDELRELERRYQDVEYVENVKDINEQISELEKEKAMLAVDNSLWAKQRKMEIDEEILKLKQQLAKEERKREYDVERRKLEDKKRTIQDELSAEEKAMQKRIDNYKEEMNKKLELTNLYEEAKRMMIQGETDKLIELLGSYDSKWQELGFKHGNAYVEEFRKQLQKVQQYMSNYFSGKSYNNSDSLKKVGVRNYLESNGYNVEWDEKTRLVYVSKNGKRGVLDTSNFELINDRYYGTIEDIKKALSKIGFYKDGGVINYTGLAMVHGSNSKPEIVLNNEQAVKLYNFIRQMSFKPFIPKLSNLQKTVQNQIIIKAPVNINAKLENLDYDIRKLGNGITRIIKNNLKSQGVCI